MNAERTRTLHSGRKVVLWFLIICGIVTGLIVVSTWAAGRERANAETPVVEQE